MNNLTDLDNSDLEKFLEDHRKLFEIINGSEYQTTKVNRPAYLPLRKMGLCFVLPLAMILNGAGEFLFCFEILKSFLKLSHPVLLISSLIMTVLSSALFYSFEIALLRKALGIPDYLTLKAEEYEKYIELIELAQAINIAYQNINNAKRIGLDLTNAEHIKNQIVLLNEKIALLKNNFNPGQEPLAFQLLRNFITLHGAFMAVAGGYFFAKSLMLVLCPALLSSPIGVIVIGLTCLVSVSLYCAMRASGMMNMKSPELMRAHALKEKLNSFKPCPDETHSNIRLFQQKPKASSSLKRSASNQSFFASVKDGFVA